MGKPYSAPDPPPLPKVRVTESSPSGVDFTGAFYIKDRVEERKLYVCIFTCATTHALHLELGWLPDGFLVAFQTCLHLYEYQRSSGYCSNIQNR